MVVFLACIFLVQGCAGFKDLSFSEYQTVRRKLSEEVEKPGSRLRDAREELQYWDDSHGELFSYSYSKRAFVSTLEGQDAEIVHLLLGGDIKWLGREMSVTFLFVGGQAVDWVSFWTWDHTPHEAVLRDIDDDGGLDLGFRLEPEVPGAHGIRQCAWPTRTEKWLRAYRITNEGFDSIFPDADRQMPVRVRLESKDPRVRLAIDIPSTVREYDLLEYSLEIVNTSTEAVAINPINPEEFLLPDVTGAAGFFTSDAVLQRGFRVQYARVERITGSDHRGLYVVLELAAD